MTTPYLRAACDCGRPEVSLDELERIERELSAQLSALREEIARRRYARRGAVERVVLAPPETREA